MRLLHKPKSNNYLELTIVNVADMWRKRNVWYQGRSRQRMETEYKIRQYGKNRDEIQKNRFHSDFLP